MSDVLNEVGLAPISAATRPVTAGRRAQSTITIAGAPFVPKPDTPNIVDALVPPSPSRGATLAEMMEATKFEVDKGDGGDITDLAQDHFLGRINRVYNWPTLSPSPLFALSGDDTVILISFSSFYHVPVCGFE